MAEKNRFSKLLEDLMAEAELKNYMLAQELQYDVSYISKWVSGRMIPAEKSARKILEGISRCIVDAASDTGRRNLLSDYQVENLEDLRLAIFDNLEVEYQYVKDMQKSTGTDVAPKTFCFPELSLLQYISRMHHPVLRRVKSLDVIAVLDLMDIGHEQRIQFTTIENEYMPEFGGYPDVHYSMIIHIRPEKWDYINDTLFMIHLLTNNTAIDFQLYGDEQASGHLIFNVKDDFMISGILINNDRCISVMISEEEENCNTVYRNIKTLCTHERLLFRKVPMNAMIAGREYLHSVLAPNLRWAIGHLTEHFLPDDLFEEILEELIITRKLEIDPDELRAIHKLTQNVMQESHIRLLIYETAFSNLVVAHKIDFYNYKVYLSVDQRMRYMKHLLSLCENNENLEVRLVYGKFVSDFEYLDNQSDFISDTITCLRLENIGSPNNCMIVNRSDIQKIFERSFEEFWNYGDNVVISDRTAILEYIQHMMHGIHLISQME